MNSNIWVTLRHKQQKIGINSFKTQLEKSIHHNYQSNNQTHDKK